MQNHPASLRSNFYVVFASLHMRLLNIKSYPGQIGLDILIPIVIAMLPILIGRAYAGPQISQVFENNTGTTNYVAYLLIGSSVFTIVSFAFWHVAYWLRWEQETGTLETLYLAPTHRIWVVAGTALYSCGRSLFTSLAAFLLGCLLLDVNPVQGHVGLALLFILVGLLPLYGLTLLFGAMILKVKEANSLVNLMQWVVSFLMGIYFPIAIFPPLLRTVALLFPPTWITNGVRSSLLGVGFFFGTWYRDLAILATFTLFTPLLGFWVFTRTENSVRRNEGMGQF